MEPANNASYKIEIIDEDAPAIAPDELYDDLPPANPQTNLNRLSGALAGLLLNEINETLQDVNKALLFLRQLETATVSRQTISGETIPPTLVENLRQSLKRSGIDENLREQFKHLQEQAQPVWANLEASLHQYWLNLRERSQQLKVAIRQDRSIKPEEYTPEEGAPAPSTPAQLVAPTPPPPPSVAPAAEPARELVVDVFNEPARSEVLVVAEHPSLQANTIHVSLVHDILTLVAIDLSGLVYTKELLLPTPVEPDTFTQTYRNGVLEIRLKAKK